MRSMRSRRSALTEPSGTSRSTYESATTNTSNLRERERERGLGFIPDAPPPDTNASHLFQSSRAYAATAPRASAQPRAPAAAPPPSSATTLSTISNVNSPRIAPSATARARRSPILSMVST